MGGLPEGGSWGTGVSSGRESSGHMDVVGTWQGMSGQWIVQMENVWHVVGVEVG